MAVMDGFMNTPISIAQMLWNHQISHPMNASITQGKGRKGIIIRQRPARRIAAVKMFFSWGQK